ncbi:MAG: hypothetical protein QOD07_1051 [Frankiaceae bacterium]|jgi:hypothetical protein|nr:hypothetical protein [Frankiaceae bacterium]
MVTDMYFSVLEVEICEALVQRLPPGPKTALVCSVTAHGLS